MEFGFDDSLFEETAEKASNRPLKSYNAKVCELLWFQSASGSDAESVLQLLKYNGDYNYRQKRYELAAKDYGDALDVLPKHNMHMRRDMMESLARCCVRLGQTGKAQRIAKEIMLSCTNRDQELQALSLLQQVYHTTSQWREEYVTLVQLTMLQPLIAQFWRQLAECVRNIMDATTSGECIPYLETNNVDPNGDHINDAKNLEDHMCNVTGERTHSADHLMFDNNTTNQSICLNKLKCTLSQMPECVSSERGSTSIEEPATAKSDYTSFLTKECNIPAMLKIDVDNVNVCNLKNFESNSVMNSVPDMQKCSHNQHGATGIFINNSFDLLQRIPLHHVLAVCLCRERCLLKMSYYSTASFGRDTYDNQLKQIDASIHNLHITTGELDRIKQLTSDTEDDGEQTNDTKIDFHHDLIADFERKWFISSHANPEEQS